MICRQEIRYRGVLRSGREVDIWIGQGAVGVHEMAAEVHQHKWRNVVVGRYRERSEPTHVAHTLGCSSVQLL